MEQSAIAAFVLLCELNMVCSSPVGFADLFKWEYWHLVRPWWQPTSVAVWGSSVAALRCDGFRLSGVQRGNERWWLAGGVALYIALFAFLFNHYIPVPDVTILLNVGAGSWHRTIHFWFSTKQAKQVYFLRRQNSHFQCNNASWLANVRLSGLGQLNLEVEASAI